jgi:uncharacterized protein YbjT (DUF2867 family)
MYVIAGATGQVGSVVVQQLLAAGQQVRVLVRDAQKGAAWSSRGAEVAVGTLGDPHFLATALRGAAGFFALLPDKTGGDFHVEQRQLGKTIAAAVKDSGIPHVVMLSSLGADLPEGTGVLIGLFHFENELRATGVKLTAIRATALQENVASAIGPARAAGIYANFYPSPDFAVSMVAVRDIGELAARALLSPPAQSENIDLEGPIYTARQIAERLGAALGKTLKIVDIPAAAHVETLMRAGLPRVGAEGLAQMYGAIVAGRIAPHGDRLEQGSTPLEATIAALLAAADPRR